MQQAEANLQVEYIPIKLIDPPILKFRNLNIGKLEEIGQSVKALGVLQPILVRPVTGGRYQLVFGNYRLAVMQSIGRDRVPAIVRTMSDEEAMLIGLVENIQRSEDVDPTIEGQMFDDLLTKGWSMPDIAKRIGKTSHYVSQRIEIYQKLHPKLLREVSRRKLPLEMAEIICKDPLAKQLEKVNKFRRQREASKKQVRGGSLCIHCPTHCP